MQLMTGDSLEPVPFRLIAIAAEQSRIADVLRLARRWPGVGFGLMLRDPEHRRDRVERLAAYALSSAIPAGVSLIANAFAVPGIAYLHLPSSRLGRAGHRACVAHGDTGMTVGYSTHDLQEAEQGAEAGGGYITVSPIFPTSSKPGHPGVGLDALRQVCQRVPVPVFALGGITAANAPEAFGAGAYGIASISLFAADHRPALESLLGLLCSGNIPATDRTSWPGRCAGRS